jgi:glucokinase
MPTMVVLDLGGTTTTAALVRHSTIVGDTVTTTSRQDAAANAIVAGLVELVERVRANDVARDVAHVAIVVPDPIDLATGTSRMRHEFAALRGVDLRAVLEQRIGVPITFVHDATAAAVGMWHELGRPAAPFGAVTLGTGVGSALLVDGTPVEGYDQLWASPYLEGTFEDAVSTRALRADHAGRAGDDVAVAEIAVRAATGNADALATFHWYGHHLGVGMARYFHRAAPTTIAVAGGVTGAWEWFEQPMTNSYGHHGGTARIVRSVVEHPALIGAALLVPESPA